MSGDGDAVIGEPKRKKDLGDESRPKPNRGRRATLREEESIIATASALAPAAKLLPIAARASTIAAKVSCPGAAAETEQGCVTGVQAEFRMRDKAPRAVVATAITIGTGRHGKSIEVATKISRIYTSVK